MPTSQPICASGSHEVRRPKPIPRAVREACLLMIYGKPGDDDAVSLDFVQASKAAGIRPNILRKWLHKSAVVALIRAERRAFREAICAGNEAALQRVRDKSLNGMATVAAVRGLEQIEETDPHRRGVVPESPHITINIVPPPASLPSPSMKVVEHAPEPLDPYRPQPQYDAEGHRLPLFDPFRDGGL